MKNYFRLTFAFLALLFVSCSGVEQPDNEKEGNSLIGIWLCTESPAGYKDCYYTFQEDGKLVRDYDPNSSESTVYVYNADAKTITTTLDSNQETFQVVSLTSSSMELMGGGFDAVSWKFQKVTTVSFPELKVEEGQEITIKVGETKKLNLSGMGIGLSTQGYSQKDGFLSDTQSDYVLKVDNETLNITGQYVGKCKLYVGSKNGGSEIAVTVEPQYPLWEHGLIFDILGADFNYNSISQEIGIDYITLNYSGSIYGYLYDDISDNIISLLYRHATGSSRDQLQLIFAFPSSKKESIDKCLNEYGELVSYPELGNPPNLYHNNTTTKLTANTKLLYSTFLLNWYIYAYYCDEAIILKFCFAYLK